MKTLWIVFKDHEEEVNNKFNPAKCAGCYLISDADVKNIVKEYGEDNVLFGKSAYDLSKKKWARIETLITLKEIQKSIDALAAVIDLKDF